MQRAVLSGLVAAALLAGCATSTPYQPLAAGSTSVGGYSERVIEPQRLRVTFAGNSLTSREDVEVAMLYRAAELTLAQGYDWFELTERGTDRRTRFYSSGPVGFAGHGAFHAPIGHHGFGYGPIGHHAFGPGGGFAMHGGWGYGMMLDSRDSFTAFGEILVRRGVKPTDNARAFDARAVMESLGPRIHRPAAKG